MGLSSTACIDHMRNYCMYCTVVQSYVVGERGGLFAWSLVKSTLVFFCREMLTIRLHLSSI